MSLNPGVLDIALAKTADESERETIRRLKENYVNLLNEQEVTLSRIQENMLRRGEEPPKHSKAFEAEIDEMVAEATEMDENTLKEAEQMSATEILSSLGYALKFNVPISRDLLKYFHEEDKPIQEACIDLQEQVADALLASSLDEAARREIAREIAGTYAAMKKSGVEIYILLEKDEEDFDSFVNGKAIGAALDELDAIAEELGTRTLSSFVTVDPWEPEEWFEPEDGIQAVKALHEALKKNPRALKKAKIVRKDLREYLDVLTHAKRHGIRFCLQLAV